MKKRFIYFILIILFSQTGIYAGELFRLARVKFDVIQDVPDKWDISRYGDDFFLDALEKNTDIELDSVRYTVLLKNLDEMTKFPFLFMTAEGDFKLSDIEGQNLKEYLQRGGFLFAEDCVYRIRRTKNINDDIQCDYFFQAFKEKIEKLFNKKMVRLSNDHEIYHCFFDLSDGLPHLQGVPHGGWALCINGRIAVFLSPSDIHCCWCALNNYYVNGTSLQLPLKTYKDGIKMGINIVIYAMTH